MIHDKDEVPMSVTNLYKPINTTLKKEGKFLLFHLVFLLVLSEGVFSQDVSVSGGVYDRASNLPMPSVIIELHRDGRVLDRDTTNSEGLFELTHIGTSMEEPNQPRQFQLSQGYPNPGRDIYFDIAYENSSTLASGVGRFHDISRAIVFDILGRTVADLTLTSRNNLNLPSGTYFVSITLAGVTTEVRKLTAVNGLGSITFLPVRNGASPKAHHPGLTNSLDRVVVLESDTYFGYDEEIRSSPMEVFIDSVRSKGSVEITFEGGEPRYVIQTMKGDTLHQGQGSFLSYSYKSPESYQALILHAIKEGFKTIADTLDIGNIIKTYTLQEPTETTRNVVNVYDLRGRLIPELQNLVFYTQIGDDVDTLRVQNGQIVFDLEGQLDDQVKIWKEELGSDKYFNNIMIFRGKNEEWDDDSYLANKITFNEALDQEGTIDTLKTTLGFLKNLQDQGETLDNYNMKNSFIILYAPDQGLPGTTYNFPSNELNKVIFGRELKNARFKGTSYGAGREAIQGYVTDFNVNSGTKLSEYEIQENAFVMKKLFDLYNLENGTKLLNYEDSVKVLTSVDQLNAERNIGSLVYFTKGNANINSQGLKLVNGNIFVNDGHAKTTSGPKFAGVFSEGGNAILGGSDGSTQFGDYILNYQNAVKVNEIFDEKGFTKEALNELDKLELLNDFAYNMSALRGLIPTGFESVYRFE